MRIRGTACTYCKMKQYNMKTCESHIKIRMDMFRHEGFSPYPGQSHYTVTWYVGMWVFTIVYKYMLLIQLSILFPILKSCFRFHLHVSYLIPIYPYSIPYQYFANFLRLTSPSQRNLSQYPQKLCSTAMLPLVQINA